MKKGLRGVFFWQVQANRLDDGTNPLQSLAQEWEEGASPGEGTGPARYATIEATCSDQRQGFLRGFDAPPP